MNFIVTRTSGMHTTQPCAEAVPQKRINIMGKEIDGWGVNIDSLEALMHFVENHDRIIVLIARSGEIPEIEIYDERRE